ncbi:hypothetical protein IGI39_001952 [Enterococcus sp. AZ135]|uniref:hypothetical protein n=1 Tax=unclassified Enterococcus TaxID=2608891 RepID=UPI003F2866EC
MNEEMKQHVDALSMSLAKEGKNRKIIVDLTGGFVLSIDEQAFNFKATGLALDNLMRSTTEGDKS